MHGAVCIVRLLQRWRPQHRLASAAAVLLFVPPLAMALTWRGEYPIEKEEIKKSLTLLKARGDHDPVYVYHGALPAFAYYRALGIAPPLEVIEGATPSDSPAMFDRQLNDLHGTFWLL